MNGEIEAGSPSSESYSPVLYNSPIETALLVRQLEDCTFDGADIQQAQMLIEHIKNMNPRAFVSSLTNDSGWYICPPGIKFFLARSSKQVYLTSVSVFDNSPHCLLLAITLDAVGGEVYLAWAFVAMGDLPSWTWFLSEFAHSLNNDRNDNLTQTSGPFGPLDRPVFEPLGLTFCTDQHDLEGIVVKTRESYHQHIQYISPLIAFPGRVDFLESQLRPCLSSSPNQTLEFIWEIVYQHRRREASRALKSLKECDSLYVEAKKGMTNFGVYRLCEFTSTQFVSISWNNDECLGQANIREPFAPNPYTVSLRVRDDRGYSVCNCSLGPEIEGHCRHALATASALCQFGCNLSKFSPFTRQNYLAMYLNGGSVYQMKRARQGPDLLLKTYGIQE